MPWEQTASMPGHKWAPGESGNPAGRPKTRLVSDAIKAELKKTVRARGVTVTKAQQIVGRMMRIALHGEDRDSIRAIDWLTKYSEGNPVQPVELDVTDLAARLSAMTGLPAGVLIKRARELREAMGPTGDTYDAPADSYERILPRRHDGSDDDDG